MRVARRTGIRGISALMLVMGGLVVFGSGAALAGGGCHSTAATSARGTHVELSGACFGPTVLYAQPGQSVTFTNKDPMDHTVTGLGGQWGSFESLRPGKSVSYRFTAAGVYPYECILHPGMVGAVVVGEVNAAAAPSQGSVLAVPPGPSAPAAAAAAAAAAKAAQPAATSSGASGWRVATLILGGLLIASSVVLGLQWLGRRRLRANA